MTGPRFTCLCGRLYIGVLIKVELVGGQVFQHLLHEGGKSGEGPLLIPLFRISILQQSQFQAKLDLCVSDTFVVRQDGMLQAACSATYST